MSDPTLADRKRRVEQRNAQPAEPTVSRVLAGPLAALGAIRYELGRDEVWVIGRLPETAAEPVAKLQPIRKRSV